MNSKCENTSYWSLKAHYTWLQFRCTY